MSKKKTQPVETATISDMDTLRKEYTQYAQVLGEKTYIYWAMRQEIRGLRAAMRGLNQKASELADKEKAGE